MAESNSNKKSSKIELKSKTLQCKNLHDYMKTLSSTVLDKLYVHPITCLAVYRLVIHNRMFELVLSSCTFRVLLQRIIRDSQTLPYTNIICRPTSSSSCDRILAV